MYEGYSRVLQPLPTAISTHECLWLANSHIDRLNGRGTIFSFQFQDPIHAGLIANRAIVTRLHGCIQGDIRGKMLSESLFNTIPHLGELDEAALLSVGIAFTFESVASN